MLLNEYYYSFFFQLHKPFSASDVGKLLKGNTFQRGPHVKNRIFDAEFIMRARPASYAGAGLRGCFKAPMRYRGHVVFVLKVQRKSF